MITFHWADDDTSQTWVCYNWKFFSSDSNTGLWSKRTSKLCPDCSNHHNWSQRTNPIFPEYTLHLEVRSRHSSLREHYFYCQSYWSRFESKHGMSILHHDKLPCFHWHLSTLTNATLISFMSFQYFVSGKHYVWHNRQLSCSIVFLLERNHRTNQGCSWLNGG